MKFIKKISNLIVFLLLSSLLLIQINTVAQTAHHPAKKLTTDAQYIKLPVSDYENRVAGVWVGQILGAMMGFRFEHTTASTLWIDKLNSKTVEVPVDDDWYYEMVAIRAFEKYGIDLTVQQLGAQWKENACGSWGSSEQARLLMARGINPPECGHPRYNKLWFSIGPQFSCDIYGALAPGMPNTAAAIARNLGHINGYAEGADGGVFVATAVSLGFTEKDPKMIVRKAAKVISTESPYRKCIDMVISLAEQGKSAQQIFDAVEDRWHIEYPATNNAVPNGGIVATSIWFGEGDFLKTVNLAFSAADYTDADCNAANAGAVMGAMNGLKGIPGHLIKPLNDRIKGSEMGGVILTPAVDEKISELTKRTIVIGKQIMAKNKVTISQNVLNIPAREPVAQAAELFQLADLMQYWNPDWKLERAGVGGAGGGMWGIRGNTFLKGDTLCTYPRDEIRSLVISRTLKIDGQKQLSFDVGVAAKKAWQLDVYINNTQALTKIIEGVNPPAQTWDNIKIDLSSYQGQTVKIRLYQKVLISGKEAGNALWKDIIIQ